MVYDGFEQTEGWFFFSARAVVSFCRNNYHGSASQQRESIARSHRIFHFQLSSFRVPAFPGDCSVGGRGNQRPDLALTKQPVRLPAAGEESVALCWGPQLLTWLGTFVPRKKEWQGCVLRFQLHSSTLWQQMSRWKDANQKFELVRLSVPDNLPAGVGLLHHLLVKGGDLSLDFLGYTMELPGALNLKTCSED